MQNVHGGSRLKRPISTILSCQAKGTEVLQIYILDVSISNTYILFKNYIVCSDSPATVRCLKEFRLQLAKDLIADYSSHKRLGHGASARCNLPLRHYPMKNKTASNRSIRCHYCSHVHQPSRCKKTVWYCGDCKLHLCHTGLDDG